jgi:uncharacterized protein (TIGR02001 family)
LVSNTAIVHHNMKSRRPSPLFALAVLRLARQRRRFTLGATISAIAAGMLPDTALAAASDWQYQLNATTDRINRGIDESAGQPSVGASVSWYPGAGWFTDLSAWTIQLAPGMPIGAKIALGPGYGWRPNADWSLQAMLTHYQFANVQQSSHFNYDDLALAAGWRDCVFASITASPNTSYGPFSRARAFSYNLTTRMLLPDGFSLISGIGYYDLRASAGAGFGYGNLGVAYQFNSVQFQLSYFGTLSGDRARETMGPVLVHRWVAQVSWHF